MKIEELTAAVTFHVEHYGQYLTDKSVFLGYLCGYFHTLPKVAKEILKDMKNNGLISVCNGKVKVEYQGVTPTTRARTIVASTDKNKLKKHKKA